VYIKPHVLDVNISYTNDTTNVVEICVRYTIWS